MWTNPFNGKPSYISYKNTRFIVFWPKNPRPLLQYLPYLKQGQYKVKLHREDSNLYMDKQTGLYIKTKYCHENRYEIEAVLVVKSNYGSNRFELIIPDN